jgi:hypothetical protein
MRSAERRFTWALVAGAVATGIGAGHTDAPVFNVLIGLAWGVPIWIAAWAVLEGIYYLQETRDEDGNAKPRRAKTSNIYVMHGRTDEVER